MSEDCEKNFLMTGKEYCSVWLLVVLAIVWRHVVTLNILYFLVHIPVSSDMKIIKFDQETQEL